MLCQLDAATRGHGAFAAGQPLRNAVIDRFLDEHFAQELMAQFPSFDTRYAHNERGEVGRKAVVPGIGKLGTAYAQFDRLMSDRRRAAARTRNPERAGVQPSHR